MIENSIISWLEKLKDIWENKHIEKLAGIMSDKFFYYESPFDTPITEIDDLISIWQSVPLNQKNIKFTYDILMFMDSKGTVNWSAEFEDTNTNNRAEMNGIYIIELDNLGRCKYFKQWWVER